MSIVLKLLQIENLDTTKQMYAQEVYFVIFKNNHNVGVSSTKMRIMCDPILHEIIILLHVCQAYDAIWLKYYTVVLKDVIKLKYTLGYFHKKNLISYSQASLICARLTNAQYTQHL